MLAIQILVGLLKVDRPFEVDNMTAHGLLLVGTFVYAQLLSIAEVEVNSLAPGGCGYNNRLLFFKLISRIDILINSCEIAPRLIPENRTDD